MCIVTNTPASVVRSFSAIKNRAIGPVFVSKCLSICSNFCVARRILLRSTIWWSTQSLVTWPNMSQRCSVAQFKPISKFSSAVCCQRRPRRWGSYCHPRHIFFVFSDVFLLLNVFIFSDIFFHININSCYDNFTFSKMMLLDACWRFKSCLHSRCSIVSTDELFIIMILSFRLSSRKFQSEIATCAEGTQVHLFLNSHLHAATSNNFDSCFPHAANSSIVFWISLFKLESFQPFPSSCHASIQLPSLVQEPMVGIPAFAQMDRIVAAHCRASTSVICIPVSFFSLKYIKRFMTYFPVGSMDVEEESSCDGPIKSWVPFERSII